MNQTATFAGLHKDKGSKVLYCTILMMMIRTLHVVGHCELPLFVCAIHSVFPSYNFIFSVTKMYTGSDCDDIEMERVDYDVNLIDMSYE